MINIEAELKRFHIGPKGVIHVGAHTAGEVATYKELGFTSIILIEANPILSDKLEEKFSSDPSIKIINAAITDFNGAIDLNVANFDQSSSILRMKDHSVIYPSIVEIGKMRVNARTLDSIFNEDGMDISLYNFLNIDIQGAELQAFIGAPQVLKQMEAINTEISFTELYEGCARFEEVEYHLADHGFNRTKLCTPHHPSWGDAFYVKRPLITMTDLGNNGRFGNQFFQYVFLHCISQRYNAVLHVPQWTGNAMFDFDDPIPQLPRKLTHINDCGESLPLVDRDGNSVTCQGLLKGAPVNLPDSDFSGYFQFHTENYRPYKDSIRERFKFTRIIQKTFSVALDAIRSLGKKIIAIHLRRGDYGYKCFYKAPCNWYETWLSNSGYNPDQFIVYIASDEPEVYKSRFQPFETLIAPQFFPSTKDPFPLLAIDFFMMTFSDVVAISNSSFSFSACLLNDRASDFFRPDPINRRIVRFDPWDSHVLDEFNFSDDYHAELNSID